MSKYKDQEGNEVSLHQLIRNEPSWAHTRILQCELAEAEVTNLKTLVRAAVMHRDEPDIVCKTKEARDDFDALAAAVEKMPSENKTYCLKHYRQTFPDKGCDICKLEADLKLMTENYNRWAKPKRRRNSGE